MSFVIADKQIVVGITGGIAAYKSAELVRGLIKQGAKVRVVMTDAAKAFITPLTFQALTGYPVSDSLLDESAEQGMGHIELARWADLILVAPATADFLARLNAGMANDLLTTLCLARTGQIAVAPAMNEKMWHANVTQENLKSLTHRFPGIHVFGPAAGEQACGDVGYGRMLEAGQLVALTVALFSEDKPLTGKHLVITAGPTLEAIDPVRFLSNHSSGKMGYALAEQAVRLGANVTLISGPVGLKVPSGVNCIQVSSAQDMYDASLNQLGNMDVFIGTAAVADYRPKHKADNKLKKDLQGAQLVIELVENPDIIATVANADRRPPWVVAFAAETDQVEDYARRKLSKKNVDAVVSNDVSRADIGFGAELNEVAWVTHSDTQHFGPASKADVALFVLNQLLHLMETQP